MKDSYSFFAMMARMKYIERWALMRNSWKENISEHSLEVAMLPTLWPFFLKKSAAGMWMKKRWH